MRRKTGVSAVYPHRVGPPQHTISQAPQPPQTALPRRLWLRQSVGWWVLPGLGSLAGCLGSAPKPVANNAPPPWVINPPADTAESYFGVGEGFDLAAAKRAALKDIAARFRVVVAGTVSSRTSVHNDQVNRSAVSTVSEEVQKTEFKNHTLLKSAASPQGVYALVRVDRADFVAETREKLDRLYAQIQAAVTGLSARPVLEQFTTLQRLRPTLQNAQALYQLLGQADQNATDRSRAAEVDRWLAQVESSASALVIALRNRREDADVASTLTSFLTDNGIRVTERPEQAVGTLELTVAQRNDEIQGSKLVKLTVNTVLRDLSGRVVASQERVQSGASVSDHGQARRQAITRLQQSLREAGPVAGLGFKFP